MKKSNPYNRRSARSIIFQIIGIVFFSAIIFFGYTRLKPFLKGPELIEHSLQGVREVDTFYITFEGYGKRIDTMKVNQSPLVLDKDGYFSKILALHPGHNIIDIEYSDRLGNRIQESYQIYVPHQDEESIFDYNYVQNMHIDYTESVSEEDEDSSDENIETVY